MLLRKSKFILAFVLTLFATMLMYTDAHALEDKVEKTYYANNVLETSKVTKYEDNGKVDKITIKTYNKKGVITNKQVIDYVKGKKLTNFKYKYVKEKQLPVSKVYYYNTHTKKQTPLEKKYATKNYDKKGKLKETIYHTKAAKQAELAAVAKKQVGKKYVYGGTSPRGFDCSGLTSYVYDQAVDKNLPHSTYAQVAKGKKVKVSKKTLQPGDLLYWGSQSMPYHVGIYIGDGKYVHASTPQTGVAVGKINNAYFKPSFAKRVL